MPAKLPPVRKSDLEPAPLPPLPFPLRDYQVAARDHALAWLADPGGPPAKLYTAPCGSGKGVIEYDILRETARLDSVLTTPRLEIVAGLLSHAGHDCDGWSDDRLAAVAARHRMYTPIRLQNVLAAGLLPYRPKLWIIDEAHHHSCMSYVRNAAYLGPYTRWLGLSACGYRGTPQSTREFLKLWGDEVNEILDIRDAAERGVVSIPRCTVWPLVDDDFIEVENGEFRVEESERAAGGVAELLARRITRAGWVSGVGRRGAYWDRPTMIAVPTRNAAYELAEALNGHYVPATAVTAETPRAERWAAFRRCEARQEAVVQIDVVSEGVDLPALARIIDLKPTMSPVRWWQQVGREMRPKAGGCEYVACNRNLERFCYLFDGLLPPAAARATEEAFAAAKDKADEGDEEESIDPDAPASLDPDRKRTSRVAARAVGVADIGRFSPARIPFLDGTWGFAYCLVRVVDNVREEYAVIGHPRFSELMYAARRSGRRPDGSVNWGRWHRTDEFPSDFRGFQSAKAKGLSPAQRNRWRQWAAGVGLDPAADVTARACEVLFVLKHCGGPPKSWRER